jgi:phage terminase large subunit-like protein
LHEYAVPSVEFAEDMRVVAKANPRMDITAAVLRDERDDPVITKEHWLRFKCNIAIRGTGTAILPEEWSALGTDERIPGGAEVWLGVDFGWKHDTTAIVPLMVGDSEHRLFGKPTSWFRRVTGLSSSLRRSRTRSVTCLSGTTSVRS